MEAAGLRLAHPVQTNIAVFEAPRPGELVAAMRKEGVLLALRNDRKVRAVTHCDAGRDPVRAAGETLSRLVRA